MEEGEVATKPEAVWVKSELPWSMDDEVAEKDITTHLSTNADIKGRLPASFWNSVVQCKAELKSEIEIEESHEEMPSRRGRPRKHPLRETSSNSHAVPLRTQVKEIIYATWEFFEKEDESIRLTNSPLIPFSKVKERTAAALKVSKNTVWRVTKEKFHSTEAGSSKLSTPGKKRPRSRTITRLDSLQGDAIRQHIYEYYSRREHPTMKKLLISLQHSDLFHGSYFSLHNVLLDIGFEYKNINGKKLLLERGDIIAKRCTFLQNLKTKNLQEVIWLDETNVNIASRDLQGTIPAKGVALVILHAGTSQGFVNGALMLLKSWQMKEYPEEMDHNRFYTWFEEQLIPNIKQNSVIVMDNAPYHIVQVDNAPTNASRKDDMVDWLIRNGVQADHTMTRGILLHLINENRPRAALCHVDKLAKKHGHEIIMLPPYHCHFNPIEQIWTQVKVSVAKFNKYSTANKVERLIADCINKVSSEDWRKSVLHVEKEIQEALQREGSMDSAVDELIINFQNCSILSSNHV